MSWEDIGVPIFKKVFSYLVEMTVSEGVGVSISSLKKVKIFLFSCMLVIDFTINEK